jgi:hypothetical protein
MMQRDGPETKQMQEKKTSYEATIIGEKRMKWKKKKKSRSQTRSVPFLFLEFVVSSVLCR